MPDNINTYLSQELEYGLARKIPISPARLYQEILIHYQPRHADPITAASDANAYAKALLAEYLQQCGKEYDTSVPDNNISENV